MWCNIWVWCNVGVVQYGCVLFTQVYTWVLEHDDESMGAGGAPDGWHAALQVVTPWEVVGVVDIKQLV